MHHRSSSRVVEEEEEFLDEDEQEGLVATLEKEVSQLTFVIYPA